MSYSLDSRAGDNATPNLELTKAIRYSYNSATKTVEVFDDNVDYISSVFNVTVGKMLYLVNSEALTGSVNDSQLIYINAVADTDNEDTLLVYYVKKEIETVKTLLKDLVQETKESNVQQRITNKYFELIYGDIIEASDIND
jgi:membrane-bound lytic murein transglycosylase MltF